MSILSTGSALARADGPDTWQIVSDKAVPLRTAASASASVIRDVQPNTRGVKNLGCQGRPSFDVWINMSDAERQQARAKVWCRVVFAGSEGWVQATHIGEPTGKAPAYDCSRAEGAVEELICREEGLAELDHRITASYWSAMSRVLDQDFREIRPLRDTQRAWIVSRNGCETAVNVIACVEESYIERIQFLNSEARP